jgi:hypothetical protein
MSLSHRSSRFLALTIIPFVVGLAVLAASPTAVAAARPSIAGAKPGAPTTGYDVSYPQCGGALPTNVAFGIVGVNRGIVFSPNPTPNPRIIDIGPARDLFG